MATADYILSELKEISLTVANLNNDNLFYVPVGYFEALPALIMNRIKDGDEEKEFLPAAQDNPFTVPPTYFEELADTILNRIKAGEASSHKEELELLSPLLGQLTKVVPFELPAGYFEEFPNDIVAGVNAIDYVNHELETHSTLIDEVKNRNVFQVPKGYFDNLPKKILNRVKGRQKSNIFHLAPKIVRYVVAALLVGAISISAWVFFEARQTVNPTVDLTGIEKISDDEIENYLETSSVAPAEGNSFISFDLKEEDVRELLADVSDEELQQYLDQHAVSKDLKTN